MIKGVCPILYRMLEFKARIGSPGNQRGCRRPESRNEGVLVQYSIDNGITWELLKVLNAEQFSTSVNTVTVPIPARAKTASTIVRWWQPITTPGDNIRSIMSINPLLLLYIPVWN